MIVSCEWAGYDLVFSLIRQNVRKRRVFGIVFFYFIFFIFIIFIIFDIECVIYLFIPLF